MEGTGFKRGGEEWIKKGWGFEVGGWFSRVPIVKKNYFYDYY